MDSIATCKKLLDELEGRQRIDGDDILVRLETVYNHLPPQTAPRLQKDLEECITRSNQILSDLFDKVEISDKSLLSVLLRTFLAYGNLRITQITYRIESEPDLELPKVKWYDLSPLLPEASNIGWKSILIHGLVKDPTTKPLQAVCHQLLLQKLHLFSIILQLDRFKSQEDRIKRNGEKVAEKIAERLFDAAHDDQEPFELDVTTFHLLFGFTSPEQQTALVEAIVAKLESGNRQLEELISHCLMDDVNLQETLFTKLVDHLRCNLIRRKRRHSVEEDESQGAISLENVLSEVIDCADPSQIIKKLPNVHVSSKGVQKAYLKRWTKLVKNILTKKTLTAKTATIILTTCSTVLITCSKHLEQDLNTELSLLLAKTIDATNLKKLDKLFKMCGTSFLIEQTRLFAESTELLDSFETPVMRYYRSFFNRQMRLYTTRHFNKDIERFSEFVEFICTRVAGKSKSNILGYVYLCELSELLTSISGKNTNKSLELYVGYSRSIAKKLYSFIKNRQFTKSVDVDEPSENGLVNGGSVHHDDESLVSDESQMIVIDALVCILRIAIDRKEQTILDTYGELMLKLFNLVCNRIGEILAQSRQGNPYKIKPIDVQLVRLCNIYTAHRATIEPYICYDLSKQICEKLLTQEHIDTIERDRESVHANRKLLYADIKSKLELLQEKDDLIYQTIINRQYANVVDQSLGQAKDISPEESCCRRYSDHLVILTEVISTVSGSCDFKAYNEVLTNVVKQFETCDALDHPQVLSLFHVLAALIPKQIDKTPEKANAFKKAFPTIGCSLMRLAKSVELGPSVLSFTNSGNHKSSGGIQCCTYSNCIRIYTFIFSRFPPAFTNSLITDALQICISSNPIRYAKYSARLHKFFIQITSAIASLLKSISMGKRDMVEQSIPVFLSVLSLLIRCIILASDRHKLEEMPKIHMNGYQNGVGDGMDKLELDKTELFEKGQIEEPCKVYESQLEHLARDVGRLLNNLCFLETKLVDYAPHLISAYIKDTQRASCPEFVKKHLDEGIFRIFNLVDAYQKDRLEQITDEGAQRKTIAGHASGSIFEMIHARLDQASREIFRDMHDNYNKFHRYLGKC